MRIHRINIQGGKRYTVHSMNHAILLEAVAVQQKNTTAVCILSLQENQESQEAVRRFVECLIKDSGCSLILVTSKSASLDPFAKEGFRSTEQGMMKEIDPLRAVIPTTCFDELGYLNRQESIQKIPYGAFTVQRCGCAAIAVYNLMHALHEKDDLSEIFSSLSRASLLQQSLGTNIMFLRANLKRRGLNTRLLIGAGKKADALKTGTCGILLYMHRHGGHYVMYQIDDFGIGTFYNAVQRRGSLHMKPELFLKEYVFMPVYAVLQVRGRRV